ncbi:MAG: hypothetical protein KR126chlam3_01140, partial [Chlamydiae bacterium]|nr:hypothetical protein [Chlamydiota bacterium]
SQIAEYGRTPLQDASMYGKAEVVEYLLSQGADVNALNEGGKALLHIAAEEGDEAAVEDLVAKGAEVNARTKDGKTALHIAAQEGHAEIVEYLPSHGADVDARDSSDWTPLHLASCHGDPSCTELLLSKGADVNARTKKGKTPLEFAMYNGHNQVVNILKKAENLDLTRMVAGETILHRNVRLKSKYAKDIIALENNGINLPDGKNGATPLHLAVANGDKELAKVLLENGALSVKRNDFGQTPMHIAAMKKDCSMAKLLWDHWGRLDVKDLEGKTPMDRAKERSQDQPVYVASFLGEMTEMQTETLEKPWLDLQFQQRDEQGKFITDRNDKPIKFDFVVDCLTSDMYEKVQSPWQVRSKALLTFLTTPFYLPLSIGKQLAGIVLDIGKIAKQVFEDVAKQIKSRKFLACLSAITITPIKNAAHAIALRIWQIAFAPLYAIGMLYAALYSQVDQLNGRKMMNKMAEGWNETGFLRNMGLAKVGNVAESERGGLKQFY